MSDYALVQRGTITITDSDTTPLKLDLPSPIKLSSAFLLTKVKDNRAPFRVLHFEDDIESTDEPSPKDVSLATPAFNLSRTTLTFGSYCKRADQGMGATAELLAGSPTQISIKWPPTLAIPDLLHVEADIVERKDLSIGCRLIKESDQDKIEITFVEAAVATGETIEIFWQVFDIENLGDDIKELLFRTQLILGYLGENSVQDAITFDDAGNMVSYRVRIYSSKDNAEAANLDIPDAEDLDVGELIRMKAIQDIDFARNDRNSLIRVVLLKAATPGVN